MSESSFPTLATYATVSISGSCWRLKNSVINRLSSWILLCSYTLMRLSQMSLASLYINTKSATSWTSPLMIVTFHLLSGFHSHKFLIIFWCLFCVCVLGHFGNLSIIDIISHCSMCMFSVEAERNPSVASIETEKQVQLLP
jgi:hypothetical protein